MSEILLQTKNIDVAYGGVTALKGVSLTIDEGEMVVVMGPNGAGKSTVLKALVGIAPRTAGEVLFHEKVIEPVVYESVGRGIAYVPQGRQLFTSLSVRENLEIGAGRVSALREVARRLEEVVDLFPALKERLGERAGNLSGGQQQMVALGRGLMSDPKVLLLDEPSLGLSPKVVSEVFEAVRSINKRHKTAICIVEHNSTSLLSFAHRAYVLAQGQVVIEERSPETLLTDKRLEEVFMGM